MLTDISQRFHGTLNEPWMDLEWTLDMWPIIILKLNVETKWILELEDYIFNSQHMIFQTSATPCKVET